MFDFSGIRFPLLMATVVLVTAGLAGSNICSGQEVALANNDNNAVEVSRSRQLKINRGALLDGPSEQIRIDTAIILLLSEQDSARALLLEALGAKNNSEAKGAVCKALSQSRSWQKSIRDKKDFLEPLLNILAGGQESESKLAAEAMLIFDYEQVHTQLKEIIENAELGPGRLNAIYALQLRPDKEAIFQLIDLVDSSDKDLAEGAEKALQASLGIPIGADKQLWEQIRKELSRKRRAEFVRDRLITQEAKVRRLEREAKLWRNLYMLALDKIYEGIKDDGQRGTFLAEHLGSSQSEVRAWALEKVSQWRAGTRTLPGELGPVLVGLISDEQRDIRLKTAKLLARMGDLNPAEQLLSQLKIETEEDVKVELLGALAEACYAAELTGAEVKDSQAIQQETLVLAGQFLFAEDNKKAQKGGEVIGKLLKPAGLPAGDIDKYLGLLEQRYGLTKDANETALRGELVGVMAGLCGEVVGCRVQAAKVFRPIFMAVLEDKTNLVREAAVTGLKNIDKAEALAILKDEKRGLINDSSAIVRAVSIELAGEVGSSDDLSWLLEKLSGNNENEPTWQAMMKIFRRCKADVVYQWLSNLEKKKITDEQLKSFLELAEKRLESENKTDWAEVARRKLADLYRQSGQYDLAAKYYGLLFASTQAGPERDVIVAALLDVRLKSGNIEAAKNLIANRLLEKELDSNDVFVTRIEEYLKDAGGTEAKKFIDLLGQIEAKDKVVWAEQLQQWHQTFVSAEKISPEVNDVSD